MLLSGFLIKKTIKEHFEGDEAPSGLFALAAGYIIFFIFVFMSVITIWMCATIKAFMICKHSKIMHILLITYCPFYATIFLLIGNSICSNRSSSSNSRSGRNKTTFDKF
jgi:hypothetical protein